MRVRLKGINQLTKRLADGRRVTYWYAWKGGPPLRGDPGSPEFIASYNEAVARKVTPPAGVLFSILQGYQGSEDFRGLADRTRKDYAGKIKLIETGLRRLSHCRHCPIGARAACSWLGAISSPLPPVGRPTTRGLCWLLSCRGRRPRACRGQPVRERWPPLPRFARRQGLDARRRGQLPRHSASAPSACLSCLRCGPGSARATCCGSHGRLTTGHTSDCGSPRPACAW